MAQQKNPKIGKSTVYRNIETLVSEGILRKFAGINGKSYYECNWETHAHLVDEKTGILCDFPLENIQIRDLPDGYEVSEVRIEIKKKSTL